MKKTYESSYLEYINKLMGHSVCSSRQETVELSAFFDELIKVTQSVQEQQGRIFFIGNGASAAFSNHMALDWSKNGGIKAGSLSDSALLTALSNDYSYEQAFTEYLKIESANQKDIVVTVSSSGNSPNVVDVLKFCQKNSIVSVGFSGLKNNNESIKLANHSLYVPAKTYGMVECIHQTFLHLWLDKFMNICEWDRDTTQNMNITGFNL